MRIGVRQKLIAAMLGASAVTTIAMGFVSQYGFTRGFIDYLNDQALARMEALVPKVAALYRQGSGWQYLRDHPRDWFDTVGVPGAGPSVIRPGNEPFKMENMDVTGTGLRITLLDEQRRFLIGYPALTPDAIYRRVVSQGATVGWLAVVPLKRISNLAETRFQRRQLALTWTIAGLAIGAAALIAALLANAFLRPIRNIADTTRRLATGDYRARVTPVSRDEIGLLSSDVNHLALALERNERMRRNLMADVSHELRTPLAVLRAELEALHDGVRNVSPDSVGSLLTEVTTLNKLVNDLHDLAIADVGALSYRKEKINLADVLLACVGAFHERFERQGLLVQSSVSGDPLMVLGDENRLQQLFNNLLENSARYTDPGGLIRVACHRDEAGAHIVIEDSAPGVSAELLPHMFERFFRADASRSRKTGGTGLGMAICRSIVEAHDGSIHAVPSGLGGLQIDVNLPLAPP